MLEFLRLYTSNFSTWAGLTIALVILCSVSTSLFEAAFKRSPPVCSASLEGLLDELIKDLSLDSGSKVDDLVARLASDGKARRRVNALLGVASREAEDLLAAALVKLLRKPEVRRAFFDMVRGG